MVQRNPTIFEQEEKMEASGDYFEMDQIVTKKPTIESFKSILKKVNLKKITKSNMLK